MSDAQPRPAGNGISDLEVKDGQIIFDSVWSSLEREIGREKLAFPREIFWLNGAPYSAPQWAAIHTNEALVIVNRLFGSREDTPITGDADVFHVANGPWMGKNALYFDGRVEKVRNP